MLRAGEISSEEITKACLERVERLNPSLEAFVLVFRRSAMRQARKFDKLMRKASGADLPLFAGVPTGIKDIDPVRFSFTRFGSRHTRYVWTPKDSVVTKLFRKAGFVFVGKLATSEFAIMPITETEIHPPCRNPWNTNHTPGGSSGGSASAVAAGLLPVAHASDGAGSIRIPAAFCHLYGLKPSRDLLPNFYKPVDQYGLSTVNSVTHTVADTAMILDALQKRQYDPAAPPEDSLFARSQRPPGRLRIRYCVNTPVCSVDPFIAESVIEVAKVLEGLGHDVEETIMPDGSVDEFLPSWCRQAANIPVFRDSLLQPALQWLRQEGRKISKKDAWERAEMLEGRVLDWFGGIDILLTPTVPRTPPEVGYWRGMPGKEAFESIIPLGAFTAMFNMSGQPAASIPVGVTENQLPFGVQLVGQRGQDALILSLSQQLETAIPWRQRKSPLFDS